MRLKLQKTIEVFLIHNIEVGRFSTGRQRFPLATDQSATNQKKIRLVTLNMTNQSQELSVVGKAHFT